MNIIKKILLYAGIERDEYQRVLPDINHANRLLAGIFSVLAVLLIGAMCIISFFVNSTSQNQIVYLAGFVASLVVVFLSFVFAQKHVWIISFLVYLAFSVFLLYGLFIGTITNPGQQTVTFMVMLVFMPILFIDRPIRVAVAELLYVLIFIYLCFQRKTGDVLSTDVMDAIIYGVLGTVSGGIISHVKIRRYVLEHKLQDASRFDQLTQMNNRNSFENDMKEYPEKCEKSLACIYVDVNGLHELNNTKGHQQGDIMLQFVAKKIREGFGKECSYRIGGDEFVVFAVDKTKEVLESKIQQLNEAVQKEGYHLAVGLEVMDVAAIDLDKLIKAAEAQMYQSKSRYYRESSKDRRRR